MSRQPEVSIYETRFPLQTASEDDACGSCFKPLKVKPKDLEYRTLKSTWAFVCLANYCSAGCVEKAHDDPETTASNIRCRLEAAR